MCARLCCVHFYPTEAGVNLTIAKFAIDSGYATPEVYGWVRQYGGARALVIKGDSRSAAPVGQPSAVEVGPRGQRLRFGVSVWPVNSGMVKEELYRWLKLDRPTEESGEPYPPGYCHFPCYGEEYFRQLTAEQIVTKIVKGYRRPEWQKMRERNEALDCRVYARAAAAVCGMDRLSESQWQELQDRLKEPPRPTAPPGPERPVRFRFDTGASWLGERREGWLRR